MKKALRVFRSLAGMDMTKAGADGVGVGGNQKVPAFLREGWSPGQNGKDSSWQ